MQQGIDKLSLNQEQLVQSQQELIQNQQTTNNRLDMLENGQRKMQKDVDFIKISIDEIWKDISTHDDKIRAFKNLSNQ